MTEYLSSFIEDIAALEPDLIFEYLLELGQSAPSISLDERTEDSEIIGCQSKVWIKYKLQEDKTFRFIIDSDAYLVKAIGFVVAQTYSGCTSNEILAITYHSFKPLANILSTPRQRGLQSMINRLHVIARDDATKD